MKELIRCMCLTPVLFVTIWSAFLIVFGAEGRQMCWSCQYLIGGRGKECTDNPGNWTQGDPRTRCPGYCVIMADFDAITGEPTYFWRGCTVDKSSKKEGCEKMNSRHHCYYICNDHYCNDKSMPRSPYLEPEDETDTALDNNCTLNMISALIAVYFFKVLFNFV